MHKAAATEMPIATVCIVDDDLGVRSSLSDLFEAVDIKVRAFESAADFLGQWKKDAVGCILLDVAMPEVGGLDLQIKLAELGNDAPIIFMSGDCDLASSVAAFRNGAKDFLLKPLDAIRVVAVASAAVESHRNIRQVAEAKMNAQSCAASLTPRERQVLSHVCDGLMNKQIAFSLGISEIMVKLHRGRMMRKMRAGSVAELVRKFDMLR